MKKVCVQIVDSKTGIYQTGMIEEPVSKGLEVQNAIGHFGVNLSGVEWINDTNVSPEVSCKSGKIKDTTKIVSIIEVVSDQPS